ncbi:ABC transporter substrate-binding protein [Nonomuraea sp. NPDC047529]|uniref:ABC transporter substrate-binding protein n=1 Tax=Nonomuraea sp. NPDC047529 TaxID=3155623 RepID=UPI0033F6B47E
MKRKTYVAALAAAGALLATAGWLAGLSPDPHQDPASAPPHRAARVSVLSGGTLTIATNRRPPSWDPAGAAGPFMENVQRLYLRTLMAHPQGRDATAREVVPDLAAAPPAVSADGTEYTFTLREGVKFEDGTPVTAADIEYGMERSRALGSSSKLAELLDPEGTFARARAKHDSADLGSIEARDKNALVFHLAGPSAEFTRLLAAPATAPVPRGRSESAYQVPQWPRARIGSRPTRAAAASASSGTPAGSRRPIRYAGRCPTGSTSP